MCDILRGTHFSACLDRPACRRPACRPQAAELKPFNQSATYDAFGVSGFILTGTAFVGSPENLNGEGTVYTYDDISDFPPTLEPTGSPVQAPTSSDTSAAALSPGAVAGIVIAVLAGVSLMVGAAYVYSIRGESELTTKLVDGFELRPAGASGSSGAFGDDNARI